MKQTRLWMCGTTLLHQLLLLGVLYSLLSNIVNSVSSPQQDTYCLFKCIDWILYGSTAVHAVRLGGRLRKRKIVSSLKDKKSIKIVLSSYYQSSYETLLFVRCIQSAGSAIGVVSNFSRCLFVQKLLTYICQWLELQSFSYRVNSLLATCHPAGKMSVNGCFCVF